MSQTALMPEVVPVEVVVDTTDADLGAAYDRVAVQNGADRGEGGKFVSPNAPEDGKAASETAKTAEDETKPVETPTVAAPAHLPQAIKAHWDKYGAEAQAAIAAHQTEMDRKFGEVGKQLGQMKPFHDEFVAAMEQYPEWRGRPPAQLAQGAIRLAAVEAHLQKNPIGTILDIAERIGVKAQLAQVFSGQQAQEGSQAHHVARLERELESLKSQLGKAASPDTIRGEISRTMLEKDAEKVTHDFASSKEHWADVEAAMPSFIGMVLEQGGQGRPMQDILADAYDMAINANPEVRAKIRAAEAKATAAQTDPKRTEAARKAASINVPSTTSGKERVPSEDELLAAAYDRRMAS